MNLPLALPKQTQLLPYQAREPIPYELATNNEIQAEAGGTLVCDTETYTNYHLVQFRNVKTHKIIQFQLGAINDYDPQKLSWIMHSYCVVGFNLNKYDCPLIWCGQKYPDLRKIQAISNEIIFNNTWPRQLQKDFDFTIHKSNVIDLIEVCPGIHSLKLYMGRLHSQRIQDLPFKPHEPLTYEQIEIVKNYCLNDLIGTEEIFLFSQERVKLREELSRDYGTDLRSRSDAQMAEAMVASEIKKQTGWWPKKADLNSEIRFNYNPPPYLQFTTLPLQRLFHDVRATEFFAHYGKMSRPEIFNSYYFQLGKLRYKFGIGGLHSCEENVSYVANRDHIIVDRDVSSYYPRIITSLGLYPQHLGPVFLDVYQQMMTDRLRAKEQKLFAKDKGLKIALNGVSGKFNSEYSIFYDPRCYIQMTLTGQLSVLMLAEMLEHHNGGIHIISANTDGLVIYCSKRNYEQLSYLVTQWEITTGFLTEETRYDSYYARDVNAYFAVKQDGSCKVKGPYSEVGSQTGTKIDNNPIALICSDAVKALLIKSIPIEKTIHECKDLTRFITVRNVASPGAHKAGHYLGKVIRWIYERRTTGYINYIASGNRVPETEGAMPVMDLPTEWPDINYQWYIEKTIEILYDIDYLKRPKQATLF